LAGSPSFDIQADVHPQVSNDSVTYYFDVLVVDMRPELVKMKFAEEEVVIFSIHPDSITAADGIESWAEGDNFGLTGAVTSEVHSGKISRYCSFSAVGYRNDRKVWVYGTRYLRPGAGAIGFDILGTGYGEGNITTDDHRTAFVSDLAIRLKGHFGRSVLTLGTAYSGNFASKYAFSLSRPILLGYAYRIGSPVSPAASFSAAFGNSRLTLKRKDLELSMNEWGGTFGAALETKFERFGYSYSTELDGYHIVSLTSFVVNTGMLHFGTRYEYVRTDDAWTIKMLFQFDGFGPDGEVETLNKVDNRPFIQKMFAYGAMVPYYPIGSLIKVIRGE
jgi:hypothetical protein